MAEVQPHRGWGGGWSISYTWALGGKKNQIKKKAMVYKQSLIVSSGSSNDIHAGSAGKDSRCG